MDDFDRQAMRALKQRQDLWLADTVYPGSRTLTKAGVPGAGPDRAGIPQGGCQRAVCQGLTTATASVIIPDHLDRM